MPHSLLAAWHSTADRLAEAVAVVEASSGRVWTFEQLRDAARLAASNRKPGVLQPACPQVAGVGFLIEVLAAWEAGCVVCPLESGAVAPRAETWDGVADAHPSAVLAKSTSGSTGAPRHVLFSADQLLADARAIMVTMGLDENRPNVSAISLAHSYGFSNLVLPLILGGAPLVLAESALPAALRGALDIVAAGAAGARQAVLPGVPALWSAWLAAGVIEAGRVAVAISAGAPLPVEIERRAWEQAGLKIHNFLGSSECGGIAYDRTDVPRDDPAVVGTPLEGVVLSTDEAGHLVVRSPAVGLGYWPAEPQSGAAGALRNGTFRTGDIAEPGESGWRLLGRASDTVNLAGRKLHPSEVESVLRGHPAVNECLVFGVPSADPARGEELVAAVSLRNAEADSWSALPAWLGGRLPAWKCPRHWWLEPGLAATNRGKLPRAEWRRRYLAVRSPAPGG